VPRVAVLLPARDAARTVRAAAVSVLRQGLRDLCLVAVDDGSKDGTGAVLAELAARDRRVVVVHGPGEGVAGALRRGLSRCDAEVVARMDADDVAWPRRLERQLAALAADPTLWAVGSRVRLFPRGAVGPGMRRHAAWLNGLSTPEELGRDLLVEAPLCHPASCIRRQALERLGGWREGDFPEDYDLWLRVAEAGGRLANLPETLLDWRDGPGRVTRTDPRCAPARHLALKVDFLLRTALRGRREVAIWGAGETGKGFAVALERGGIGVALFVDVDPRKVGRRRRGAPVVGPAEVGRARGLPLLVAVGAPGARPLIRAALAAQGFRELVDYWCVS
jgi:glycosyltransferase involved in cell wall biosynthesis